MELNEEQKRAVRAAARDRKRKQRQRDKQRRIRALEAQTLAAERAERRRRNLHFFGEFKSGRNATTFQDELAIHREFLRALHEPDVCNGETLRLVAQRTYQAWTNGAFANRDGQTIYVPGFNRAAQQFDSDFGFSVNDISFEDAWTPPSDCTGDEVIDVTTLPPLPKLSEPKSKKVELEVRPATPPTAPSTTVRQQQPNAIHFMYVPVDANRYLSDGRI